MAKTSFLKRMEMLKEVTLEHYEGQKSTMLINKIDFPFPLKFSKLCLMIEAKIVTQCVLKVLGGNISGSYR